MFDWVLNTPLYLIEYRGVFRTLQKIRDRAFFAKVGKSFKPQTIFVKNSIKDSSKYASGILPKLSENGYLKVL